tara:strand:+ start:180 stop:782 length:603 start_codon:yes stop_codon:yes gene_type:complete
MKIGHKYVHPNHPAALVFIGFNGEGNARLVTDNQALFDLLGEPYSVDAIQRLANRVDLDKVSEPCTVLTTSATDWHSLDEIETQIATLTAKLNAAKTQRDLLNSPTRYDTDMPGGSTYNGFIRDFLSRCEKIGVNTDDYTFHGKAGASTLAVCHNDWSKSGEDNMTPDSEVFFDMVNEPKYARVDARLMLTCGMTRLTEY